MCNFRFYIYGVPLNGGDREFLTTSLGEEGATDYAMKHKQLFPKRYKEYELCRGHDSLLLTIENEECK